MIFSHVESDLPLVVWWQAPLQRGFDERLYSVMDGLMIDSDAWPDPAVGFAQLESALANKTTRFALADLSWMRSHIMRTALATACHDQRAIASLPTVNRLTIKHAPGARITALLFAAWVGTQLGCRTAPGGQQLLRGEGADIEVRLEQGGAGSALQSVELSGPCSCIAVRRESGSRFVRACMDQDRVHREDLLPADQATDAELITEQLSRLGGSSRYLGVLPLLKHWL
jgi:glucose-6-phosphate dehydrogenase assembly protein OpcA